MLCHAGQFGVLSWSPDGDKVMYVAEAKCPKSSSYFPASLDKPGMCSVTCIDPTTAELRVPFSNTCVALFGTVLSEEF